MFSLRDNDLEFSSLDEMRQRRSVCHGLAHVTDPTAEKNAALAKNHSMSTIPISSLGS